MLKKLADQDYYQVLEVDYRATPQQIKEAYERAKELYGADSLVSISILSEEERSRILHRIREAYNTLIAEESRRLYDERLLESSPRLRERLEGASPPKEEPGPSPEHRAEPVEPAAGKSRPAPVRPYPRLVATEESAPATRSPLQLGIKDVATGEFLRRARESAGLDLRSISEETKIGVTMLSYIEDERVERLPAPVYLRNFVCQYARCLGLDEEKVARTYLARIRRLQSTT